jgi:ABC-type amino acid transport substrate-binding protein
MKLLLSIICFVTTTSASGRSLTASAPDWPPFFIQESKTARGMGWEILSQCGEKIDSNVSFDMYPIRRMFKQMEQGDLDINIMSYKNDRAKILEYGKEVVFSNTYAVWTGVHVKKTIRRISDLDGLSVGQLVGLRPSDQFRDYFEQRKRKGGTVESLELNDPDQVVKMLAKKRIDATIVSSPEIRWRSKKLQLQDKIRNTNFSLQTQDYFFVMSKNSPFYKRDPSIIRRLDTCVKAMKLSGRWQSLKKQYDL